MVFSGAALPAPYSILEVGPLGPAGGAAEGPELGYAGRVLRTRGLGEGPSTGRRASGWFPKLATRR